MDIVQLLELLAEGYSCTYQDAAEEIKKLRKKIKKLEAKLYYYKVQESLMRPIIDDNFKG